MATSTSTTDEKCLEVQGGDSSTQPAIYPQLTNGVHPGYQNQGMAPPYDGAEPVPVNVVTSQLPAQVTTTVNAVPFQTKSIVDTYILAIGLGFVGAHHFYLRRPGFGVLYLFTFGLFGVGYISDWFRVPCLVKDANKRIANPTQRQEKSLYDAYILWFPGGIFGFHHFYLERYAWGFLYLFTLGLLGIGWLVDGIRMRWLVKSANKRFAERTEEENFKSLCTAYTFTLFPFTGLLGFQHYYLGRVIPGLFYTLTLGNFGIGWLMDICRMPIVVKRENAKYQHKDLIGKAYLDDAYMYCFPFGFLGLHHFYLGRNGWGVLYLFSLGLFGIGWISDWVRLPCLVAEYNKAHFNKTNAHANGATVSTIVIQGQNGYPTYPGYQTNFPPAIYPQPTPGVYPSQGQDSWTTVTSSNVSDQPPSYAETMDNNANEQTASAPPSFEKE